MRCGWRSWWLHHLACAEAATSASTCRVLSHPWSQSPSDEWLWPGCDVLAPNFEELGTLALSCSMLSMTFTAMTCWWRRCWLVVMICVVGSPCEAGPCIVSQPGLCGGTPACLVGGRWLLMPLMVLLCGAPLAWCFGRCASVCRAV